MQDYIDKISDFEFEMLQSVQGTNGRASCQDNPKTFKLMRKAQFLTWNKDILASYYKDLVEAKKIGRNLLGEKFAFMMESTHPYEFASMKDALPILSLEFIQNREAIIEIYMQWEQSLLDNYPYVKSQGRPSFSHDDRLKGTSIETYLRGEFSTYSLETLSLILLHVQKCFEEKRNLGEENLYIMMLDYGFSSIQDAEDWARSKTSKII